MEDKCLTTDIVDLVFEENIKQLNKWGIQNRSPFEWLTYLAEEVGELAEAIQNSEYHNGEKRNVVNEAIQAATLALKIAEMHREF